MAYHYDTDNIFAKILRGEIPNDTVYETDMCLVFRDIAPQAPHHVLVIPKGAYVSYDHFALEASDAEIVDFTRCIGHVCQMLGVDLGSGGDGFRVIANTGEHGLQEVPHLHVHILAGRPIGPLVMPS
ncbi:MAG: histidine triad nucleotide-binding protein [Rhodobacteraceae bacterium]|nr:MAG: histidine triad nucleotide-binding protein [Paracoccaceae bacterium]